MTPDSILCEWFDFDPANPYGTHRHALAAAVMATTGPVLELGMGNFSTPWLARLCAAMDRDFYSFETQADWKANYDQWHGGRNRILRVPTYDATLYTFTRWGVAFVDHAPDELRVPALLALANRADLVVVHDTDPGNCYSAAWPHYRWKRDFTAASPHTSILSNTVDPIGIQEH